jgi:integrase/recombinase XerD
MTDECISPLRQRMIEDMSLRHFGEKTQKDYIRAVKNLTIFLGRSPDTATAEDLRLFQLHLTENRVRPPSINFTVTALRFFFTVTLDRADAIKHLTFVAEPRKIPVVLSPEEVARFLEAAPGVKYKAAFSAAYGAGLRVSEVAALKVSDIDSERMLLRIEQGKGRKDRHAMLSPVCLNFCATGGALRGQRLGCSQAAIRSNPCRRASSTGPAMRQRTWRRSPSACPRTRCGIVLQPIFWSRTPTSE